MENLSFFGYRGDGQFQSCIHGARARNGVKIVETDFHADTR